MGENLIKKIATIVFVSITLFCSGIILYTVTHKPQDQAAEPAPVQNVSGEETAGEVPVGGDNEKNAVTPPPTPTPRTGNLMPYLTSGDGKVAYITFDDGPSVNTPEILEILDRFGAKATFFVTGSNAEKYPDLVKQEADSGHTVGNHSYSHNYKAIYQSTDSFQQDVQQAYDVIAGIIGQERTYKLFRFPGGAADGTAIKFAGTLEKMGFCYVDWNALNSDADGKKFSLERSIQSIKDTTKGHDRVVILMHDAPAKKLTVKSLPEILEYLQAEGYRFDPIVP